MDLRPTSNAAAATKVSNPPASGLTNSEKHRSELPGEQIGPNQTTHAVSAIGFRISDRDLSKTKNYTGLSEAIVSKVAAELGLPICLYARGTSDSLLERQKNWGDGRIPFEWVSRPSAAPVREYLDNVPENLRQTYTCLHQNPWYDYEDVLLKELSAASYAKIVLIVSFGIR